jgi:phage replication initiation protein
MRPAPSALATPDIIRRASMSPADFAKDQAWLDELVAEQRAHAGRQAEARSGFAPPRVTRGERVEAHLVSVDGEIKEVPARRGWGGDCAFIDWLNFTVHESTFEWSGDGVVSDDQLIVEASRVLEGIFGFGITARREKGAMFYLRSYTLGDSFGLVCHGRQRNTVLISLSGTGCAAALPGWEKRLFEFLSKRASSPRITRVDLAHDVFDGVAYSVDRAFADFHAGAFRCGGRTPDCEQRGNWVNPNGKGRTFYVGHRTNGKYFRGYEKGRELGDKESEWVRVEVEFKSVDRDLPFDILLRAGEYLAAAYPALAWISDTSQRIATQKKSAEISYQKVVEWAKHQCGAAIWTIAQVEGSLEAAFALVSKVGKVPSRLKIPAFDSVTDFLHNHKRDVVRIYRRVFEVRSFSVYNFERA